MDPGAAGGSADASACTPDDCQNVVCADAAPCNERSLCAANKLCVFDISDKRGHTLTCNSGGMCIVNATGALSMSYTGSSVGWSQGCARPLPQDMAPTSSDPHAFTGRMHTWRPLSLEMALDSLHRSAGLLSVRRTVVDSDSPLLVHCTGDSSCQATTVACKDDCVIRCVGNNACVGLRVSCPSGSNCKVRMPRAWAH